MDIDTLPSPSTLVNMLAEMKGLACQQLGEVLTQERNLTLHSDGISKFGLHYVGFQMSTETSAYSLGLSEMVTGSACQTLTTFKQILQDINRFVTGPLWRVMESKDTTILSINERFERLF